MTVQEVAVRTLDELLDASAAAPEFKNAMRRLAEGKPQDRIRANAGGPPVKVLRVAMKLIEERPGDAIASLAIEGHSGCSEFAGSGVMQPGGVRFEFEWDCAWRATERGWRDPFGDPDQIRAARTFGYQCFRRFEIAGDAR